MSSSLGLRIFLAVSIPLTVSLKVLAAQPADLRPTELLEARLGEFLTRSGFAVERLEVQNRTFIGATLDDCRLLVLEATPEAIPATPCKSTERIGAQRRTIGSCSSSTVVSTRSSRPEGRCLRICGVDSSGGWVSIAPGRRYLWSEPQEPARSKNSLGERSRGWTEAGTVPDWFVVLSTRFPRRRTLSRACGAPDNCDATRRGPYLPAAALLFNAGEDSFRVLR